MAKSKYRGKYPTRIKAVSSTTTDGVYWVQTNDGTSYFVSVAACLNAGYTISISQLVGLYASTLGHILHSSVALAAAHHDAQKWLRARWGHLQHAKRMRHCATSTSNYYSHAQRLAHKQVQYSSTAHARLAHNAYMAAQAHYVHMQALLNAGT